MQHLKTILFFLLCLAVGIAIGKSYIYFTRPAHNPDFTNSLAPTIVTGTGDAPAHHGFTLTPAALPNLPQFLPQAQAAFATTIALEYAPTLTPNALAAAAKTAHQKGLTLALLPPPQFTSQNPFPKPLADIADLAQAANIDFLCISWLNTQPDSAFWLQQIQALRPRYKGKIILAATPPILPTLDCLDAPDLIGAIGPIPLPRRLPNSPDSVDLHDLRVAWDCALTSIESLARAHTTPDHTIQIALLHMNIPAEVSSRLPPAGTPEKLAPNPALQKMLYEALLLETKGRNQYTDLMLFNWDPTPSNPLATLLPKITEAWDPKKPLQKPTEPPPEATLPDLPDLPPELTDTPTTLLDTKPN